MAIAVAGPLSRFFANGDEAEAQRLRTGIEAWREDLCRGVADKVSAQLEWDEASDASFEGDLGESGWNAVRLFAFYAERSDMDWPDRVPPLLELDPSWREASDQKFGKSLYGQLLACDLWLPGEFPVTVRAPRPDGAESEIGSLHVLVEQLQWLNQRTFQADREEIATWHEQPAPADGLFLMATRRGYAALVDAALAAQAATVPLVMRSE